MWPNLLSYCLQMSNLFFISDTHFGHKAVIQFCNRPFSSVEEMNERLIENWNSVVRDQDEVIHVGDVMFAGKPNLILPRLKGNKKLVLGNHDHYKNLKVYFNKFYGAKYQSTMLVTHVPVHINCLGKRFTHNIHGHLHQNNVQCRMEYVQESNNGDSITRWDERDPHYINVSVEQINYTPISWEELKKKHGI